MFTGVLLLPSEIWPCTKALSVSIREQRDMHSICVVFAITCTFRSAVSILDYEPWVLLCTLSPLIILIHWPRVPLCRNQQHEYALSCCVCKHVFSLCGVLITLLVCLVHDANCFREITAIMCSALPGFGGLILVGGWTDLRAMSLESGLECGIVFSLPLVTLLLTDHDAARALALASTVALLSAATSEQRRRVKSLRQL